MRLKKFLLVILTLGIFIPLSAASADVSSETTRALILLKSKNAQERKASALQLGSLKDPKGFEPLVHALKDKDPDVRRSAAWALGEISNARAIPDLISLGKRDPEARMMVARSLGSLQSDAALAYLKQLLREEDSLLVFEAALALGKYPPEKSSAALISALKYVDAYGRKTIVNLLGKNRIKEALEPLKEIALKDKDHSTGVSAVEALGRLGLPQGVPILKQVLIERVDETYRVAALRSLGGIQSEESLTILLGYLNHLNLTYQKAAVEALAELGDPRARGPLLSLKAQNEKDLGPTIDFALKRIRASP